MVYLFFLLHLFNVKYLGDEKIKKMKVKLSFNFHDFCNGISKVGNLVFYRFAHFEFFEH